MKNKKIVGYILKKKYPGCSKKVGDFEPYTTGVFSHFPEIWMPIYEDCEESPAPGNNGKTIVIHCLKKLSTTGIVGAIGISNNEKYIQGAAITCYGVFEAIRLGYTVIVLPPM